MSAPLTLRFLASAERADTLPDSDGEIAFIGRSNVGKSSLINALSGRKPVAHVSKTPGRTQLLNCFEYVPEGRPTRTTVVDCPGYGYAKVPARIRQQWQPMIEGYLTRREPLHMILALVDGEIGPTQLDLQLLEWLRAHGLPFTVIATKHDKVKASARDKRKKELAAACGLAPGGVIWVSAAKHVNIDRLRDLARGWLSGGDPAH